MPTERHTAIPRSTASRQPTTSVALKLIDIDHAAATRTVLKANVLCH
jgi:hypothetical protein